MQLGQLILAALEQAREQIVKPANVNGIWVALSAGVDSTVLLHALVNLLSTLPNTGKVRVKAIHVHHGLSENADGWVKQAQSLCCQLSADYADRVTVECIVERVQLQASSYDGIEQAARTARYQVFEQHCQAGDVLLQGHHLDDQIETFFMRAIRGSGLTGLSGIPQQRNLSRQNSCQILRPFLTIEKKQLIEYANTHNLRWVEDESNLNLEIDRNWWRNELLPQVWQRYPQQKKALSRTINNIQHEKNLLQQLLIEKLTSTNEGSLINDGLVNDRIHPALNSILHFNLQILQNVNQATGISYLRAWLAQHVDVLPSIIQMQTIYTDMVLAPQDGNPNMTWASYSLHRYKNDVYLMCTPAQRQPHCDWSNDWPSDWPSDWNGEPHHGFSGQLSCEKSTAVGALHPAHYNIRTWQAGDVAKPLNRSTRKMKKWWQDYNVPSWVRASWPIIVNKYTDEIAAVPGLFVCQGYGCAENQPGWLLEYHIAFMTINTLKI